MRGCGYTYGVFERSLVCQEANNISMSTQGIPGKYFLINIATLAQVRISKDITQGL